MVSEQFIAAHQRKRSEKGTGRTQVLAEGRNFGKTAEQEHGSHAYEQNKNCVFSIFQNAVAGKFFSFMKNRNLMEKILQKTKRTEPAAYEAPEKTSEKEEESQYCKRNLESALIQKRLERSDGTGCDGSGTGVAVKPRHAGVF